MDFKKGAKHLKRLIDGNTTISSLFKYDKLRGQKYSVQFDDILFDYSHNYLDDQALNWLLSNIDEKIITQINDMFNGSYINFTEHQAVMHTAMRDNLAKPITDISKSEISAIVKIRAKIEKITEDFNKGKLKGFTGKILKNIVNVGIGGSYLGPLLASTALKEYSINNHTLRFINNLDPNNMKDELDGLNLEETLFIISSKSFTTSETVIHTKKIIEMLTQVTGSKKNVFNHLLAVTANPEKAINIGFSEKMVFTYPQSIGGRYSVWSPVGIPIAMKIGFVNFLEFLQGAHSIDNHYKNTTPSKNIPILMALIGIWHRNIAKQNTIAVIPYEQRLMYLPSYLQQLDMESNGKYITKNNNVSKLETGPILWGDVGTNAQHALFQWLHQSTDKAPIDFLVAVNQTADKKNNNLILSNCLGQIYALTKGRNYQETQKILLENNQNTANLKHRVFEGNRSSNLIIYDHLSPKVLGQIIALYEHKIHLQSLLWNINAFDQWGVELGKEKAKDLENFFEENNCADPPLEIKHNIDYIKATRKN